MKFNLNYFLTSIVVLVVGVLVNFFKFNDGIMFSYNDFFGGGSIVIIVGLIYMLFAFSFFSANRFSFLSTLCIYVSIIDYVVVYTLLTSVFAGEEIYPGVFFLPMLILLPTAVILLVMGMIYTLFKKNKNNNQVSTT